MSTLQEKITQFIADAELARKFVFGSADEDVRDGLPTLAKYVATTAKGDKGDTGNTGSQGLKGDKGDTGNTGIQGIPGAYAGKGDKGDKGDTGDQGIQGNTGPKGDPGNTGADSTVAGPVGPQGLKGDTGNTGATGPQGIQGESGDSGLPNGGTPGQIIVNTASGDGGWQDMPESGGGGKVLQVVTNSTIVGMSNNSNIFVDTNLSASITPAAGSKVLVTVSQPLQLLTGSGTSAKANMQIIRDTSILALHRGVIGIHRAGQSWGSINSVVNITELDQTPGGDGETSITYKTQVSMLDTAASQYVAAQYYNYDPVTGINLTARATITLIEIGA